jgi:hypothetical protein
LMDQVEFLLWDVNASKHPQQKIIHRSLQFIVPLPNITKNANEGFNQNTGLSSCQSIIYFKYI